MIAVAALRDKYSVSHCQDIGEFFGMPWGEFYLRLKSMKKDEYQDNERLVFYLKDRVDEKLLEKFFRDFYQQIKAIDIPNFFIVLVLPSERESQIVEQAYSRARHDCDPCIIIDPSIISDVQQSKTIDHSRATFGMPDTACPLPWNSLDVSPVGTFAPCCFYQGAVTRDNGTLFDPTVDSISDVYNSQYMKKLRQLFREGVRLKSCSRCWKEEESGAVSKRQLYALRFGDDSRAINWEEDDVKNLKMLSVAFGNVCNFKCRICSEKSSSKIAGEILTTLPDQLKKTSGAYSALEKGRWIQNSENFWSDVSDNSQITYFDFSGGEPLLDKHHLLALKSMVEKGIAKDISIHYNTNGSIINDQLLEIWSHFKKIDLAVSVDDTGARFNLQRPGGDQFNWDVVDKNIRYIKENKTSNIIMNMHCAISIMNVHYLPELCDWMSEIGFEDLHFSVLYNPAHLSLLEIPKAAANLSLAKLQSYNFDDRVRSFADTVMGLLSRAKRETNAEFVNYTNKLDAVRKEKFAEVHHEVAQALGLV